MNSHQQLSFYIPRISTQYNKKDVKTIFLELDIGKVNRVDFTPINKKPGFIEKNDNFNIKSAFVHMKYINSNPFTEAIFKKVYLDSEGFKIYPAGNHMYWLLLKNNNPIEDTMMNKHQIVENCRNLETRIEEQADTIKNLEDKLAGVQNVVEQLIDGLYCPVTQNPAFLMTRDELHRTELHRNAYLSQFSKVKNNPYKWDHYPTTRQGDFNEIKIKNIERVLERTNKLLFEITGKKIDIESELSENDNYLDEDNISDINVDDQNDDINTTISYSTHSSMPPLLSMYDADSISNSSYSSSIIERRRISSELCGNE